MQERREKMSNEVKENVENRVVSILTPYIKERKIIGSYLVPYAYGTTKKLDLTVITTEPTLLDSEIIEESGIVIVKTTHEWNQFGERSEERNHPNRRLVKDLKEGMIIYDPQGILKSRQKQLQGKDELGDYHNIWTFSNEIREKIETNHDQNDRPKIQKKKNKKRRR